MARQAFLGSDHAGFNLKRSVADHLSGKGIDVFDLGVGPGERGDYPVYAAKVAQAVASKEGALGFLFCGSGVGVSMAANKVPKVRSVVCSEPYSALMARQHIDANVLALGERVVGVELALLIVDAFLNAEFEGGRHERRVAMLSSIEKGEMT